MFIKRRKNNGSIFTLLIKGAMIFALLTGVNTLSLFGDEPQHIRQSLRALGMGNAFTAVANDENALFYNPAGLQLLQQHIVEIISLNATMNQNMIDMSSESGNDANAFLGKLIGEKVYTELNLGLLSISGPGWGYSIFGSYALDATVRNPTVPYLDLKTYVQYGAVGGLAFDFLDERLDIGVAVKVISRNGIGKEVHIVDFLDDDFGDEIQDEFDTKSNFASDVGALYHFDQLYNFAPRLSLVIRNIGGLDFGSSGEIPMTIDMGVATESELLGFDFILAADVVDVTYQATQYKSSKRNLKIGAEMGMFKRTNGHHALSFRIGRNGTYSTFGFSFNPPLLPVKIDYASWSEEVGAVGGEKEDKRQAIQLAINF